MKYIHAVKGSMIAFVLFGVMAFAVHGYGPSASVETILTVSSFLFAIMAGFFISRLNARYNKVIEHINNEDSAFLSLYKTAQFFGDRFLEKIADVIDMYYIKAYSSDVGNFYYKETAPHFHALYDLLYEHELGDSREHVALDAMLSDLSDIEASRNQSSVLSREKLTYGQWLILLALASIIVFSIYYLKVPQLYSQIISVLLCTVIVLVLLTIRDLQNLKLGGLALSVESGQEVFEYIGKLRYYPEFLLKDGTVKVPVDVKEYRLGTQKKGEDPKIKVVKNA